MSPKPDRSAQGTLQADYGIITALRDELTGLRAILGPTEEVQLGDRDIRYYYRWRVPCQDGSVVVVICACANDMGQGPALNVTRDLIAAWRPRHLLLIGIAGGFFDRGASYGDVITPLQVHYYEPGKLVPVGAKPLPRIPRWRIFRASVKLHSAVEALAVQDNKAWACRITIPRPDGIEGAVPKVLRADLASGEEVWASLESAAAQEVFAYSDKIVGVETEAAGFLSAVEECAQPPDALVVKAFSDLVEGKDDRWRAFASAASAAFAVALIGKVGSRYGAASPLKFVKGKKRFAVALSLLSAVIVIVLSLVQRPEPVLWVAIDEFEVSGYSPASGGPSGSQIRDELTQKLGVVRSRPALRLACLACSEVTGAMMERFRLDYLIRGRLDGHTQPKLSASLYDREMAFTAAVEAEGVLSLPALEDELARAILAALERRGLAVDSVSLEALSTVPTADPEALALNNRGALALRARDAEEARAAFEGALTLDPFFAAAHSNLALAAQLTGDHTAALKGFRRAVELLPGYAPFRFNLGSFYLHGRSSDDEGRSLAAIEEFRQAVDLDPLYVEAWIELGNAQLSAGAPAAARHSLERAIALEPSRPEAVKNLAWVALAEGDAGEAARGFESALAVYPWTERLRRMESTAGLVAARRALDDLTGTCNALEELRKLDPAGLSQWSKQAHSVAASLPAPCPDTSQTYGRTSQ